MTGPIYPAPYTPFYALWLKIVTNKKKVDSL